MDLRAVASDMASVQPSPGADWLWEQAFIALKFAGSRSIELPSQRYFYPFCDGLPGGIGGYDYAANPCGFASVHFGALLEKPGDLVAQRLAQGVLDRSKKPSVPPKDVKRPKK
jgi:hypothetical protein